MSEVRGVDFRKNVRNESEEGSGPGGGPGRLATGPSYARLVALGLSWLPGSSSTEP